MYLFSKTKQISKNSNKNQLYQFCQICSISIFILPITNFLSTSKQEWQLVFQRHKQEDFLFVFVMKILNPKPKYFQEQWKYLTRQSSSLEMHFSLYTFYGSPIAGSRAKFAQNILLICTEKCKVSMYLGLCRASMWDFLCKKSTSFRKKAPS